MAEGNASTEYPKEGVNFLLQTVRKIYTNSGQVRMHRRGIEDGEALLNGEPVKTAQMSILATSKIVGEDKIPFFPGTSSEYVKKLIVFQLEAERRCKIFFLKGGFYLS